VVPELIQGGHQVVGLARSDASAAAVKAMGAEVRRGDLADLTDLRKATADADAVIHLAFDHATMSAGDFPGAVATDMAVVQALGDALAGTGKTLAGVGLTHTGDAKRDAAIDANPRSAVARAITGFRKRRAHHLRRDPSGHPQHAGPTWFHPTLIKIARDTGVSGYVGDGANHWPAGHVLGIGRLYRLVLVKAPAGAQLYGAAEQASRYVRSPRPSDAAWTSRPWASRPSRPPTTPRPSHSSRLTSRCPTRKPGNYQLTPPRATVLFAHAELNEAMGLLPGRSACGAGHPHSRTAGNARSCISCTAPAHVSASSNPPVGSSI
jgi:putative NAD(P)-binding protein